MTRTRRTGRGKAPAGGGKVVIEAVPVTQQTNQGQQTTPSNPAGQVKPVGQVKPADRTNEVERVEEPPGATHLVVFRAQDGSRQFLMATDLDEAMIHAETLANERDNNSSRIFELREIGIDYNTYYRVELRRTEPQIEAGSARETPPSAEGDDGQQPRVVVASA